MPADILTTPHILQCSDWSATEGDVFQQGQSTLEKLSKSKIRPTRIASEDTSSSNSNRGKGKSDTQSNLSRRCSSISPVHKGLLAGVLTGALLSAVILPLWLTSVVNKTSTTVKTPSAAILRWNSVGITIAGVMNQKGTAPNLLDWPMGLALDTSNALYVAEYSNNRVQKFPFGISNGTTVAGQSNGVQNRTPDTLNFPAGILVDDRDRLYVADSGNSRIQLWPSGATAGSTAAGNGTAGTSDSQLNVTYGVAYDPSTDTLYAADYGNNRIMAYKSGASSGTLIAGGNGLGLNNTQLYNPSTLYFDAPSNSLIIANRYAHNIVRWTLGDTHWTLLAGSTNRTSGSLSTLLNSPFGVTSDPMGNIYVSDTSNHRIQLFLAGQLSGITIAGSTGIRGNDSNLLYAPYAVQLDSQLNLYVADRNNHRVQKYLRY